MLLKIAWRNVWRARIRSLVVITAIALGLWAGTFTAGFYEGMMKQKINDVIESEMSHLQFHDSTFREEYLSKYYMKDAAEVASKLRERDHVTSISGRVISTAMMGSANKNGGVKLIGVQPTDEAETTHLDEKLIEGEYFEGVKRNPILISQKMADAYKVKLRSKLVLTVQNLDREITAASFRVVGIYKSGNGMVDEVNAYVMREDLQRLLQLDESDYHEIAVMLDDHELAESTAAELQSEYPEFEVLPWLDLASGMRYIVEASGMFSLIIVMIILVALLFSVINTMLMAVMERTRELGMLMAVGMNKTKVFLMIMLETLFLSMIGGPLGLLIAFLFIQSTGQAGIDLGAIGETYSDLGFAAVVYPELPLSEYLRITFLVLLMAVVAAIYPARKALKLNPSDAIRKI